MGNLSTSPSAHLYDVMSSEKGLFYLVEKTTRKEHLLKTIPVDTVANLQRIKNIVEQRRRHHHEHIAMLKGTHQSNEEYQVNEDNSVSVLYEFPFRTLED